MRYAKAFDSPAVQDQFLSRPHFDELEFEREFLGRRVRIHGPAQQHHALFHLRRTDNPQRLPARLRIGKLQKQEGQSGEMIPVKMTEKNRVNRRGRQTMTIHGCQCRRTAVEQHRSLRILDQVGRLKSSSRGECVSGAKKDNAIGLHEASIPLLKPHGFQHHSLAIAFAGMWPLAASGRREQKLRGIRKKAAARATISSLR